VSEEADTDDRKKGYGKKRRPVHGWQHTHNGYKRYCLTGYRHKQIAKKR